MSDQICDGRPFNKTRLNLNVLLATFTTNQGMCKFKCKNWVQVTCWVSFWLRHHPNASHISCVVVSGVQYPTRIDATAQNISSLALCPESTGSVSSPLVSASTSSLLSGSPASQQSKITMMCLVSGLQGMHIVETSSKAKYQAYWACVHCAPPALHYVHAATWKT